jgi:excisionase family DNA binding protein
MVRHRLLKPRQIAEVLDINVYTVYRIIHTKQIAAIVVNRHYYINPDDLNKFIKTRKERTKREASKN